jgi:formate dehydrogenase maturation protein FdhE
LREKKRAREKKPVETKRCRKCGAVKPIADFALNKGKADGYHYWCKACTNEYNKERNQCLYTEAFVRAKNLKQLYGITK